MKIKKSYLAFFIGLAIFTAFIFLPHKTFASTAVSANISSDTAWDPSGSPYVISGALNVDSGVTLTINAGTVVKFGQGSWLNVSGTLSALDCKLADIFYVHKR